MSGDWRLVVDGLSIFDGAELAVDTKMVSLTARRRATDNIGVVFVKSILPIAEN